MLPQEDTVPAIIVDTREKQSGLVELLRAQEFVDVQEQQLSSGDIIIDDMGIERKTGADLVSSLIDGRFFRQMIILKRTFRRRLLVIEGMPMASKRLSERAIQGAILRTIGAFQIPILYTCSTHDTAQKLLHLAFQTFLSAAGQIRERSLRDPDTRAFYQRFILAGVPGIGVARAQALLEHFGSLRAVFDASAADLDKVAGIGPVHAQRLAELATCKVAALPPPPLLLPAAGRAKW